MFEKPSDGWPRRSRRWRVPAALFAIAMLSMAIASRPADGMPVRGQASTAARTVGSTYPVVARMPRWLSAASQVTRIGVGRSKAKSPGANSLAVPCHRSGTLVSSCRILTGAYAGPSDGQTPGAAFDGFEKLVGPQTIVHYYYQGTQVFPAQWQIDLAKENGVHRILFANWKPEAGKSWAAVAAGRSDWYIDKEAEYLKANFTKKFYLGIHHEPENEVVQVAGSGYTAADYRAMYRHVVDRLRKDGVTNAVYVMNYMGTQMYSIEPWYNQLWPGSAYVDWIAFDPYATSTQNGQVGGMDAIMNRHWGDEFPGAYNWAQRHHPHKPVMLAEWGIGEKPGDPDWKAWFFQDIARSADHYPHLKAMVYFDKRVTPKAGDVRVNTSPAALESYKKMLVSDPFTATN